MWDNVQMDNLLRAERTSEHPTVTDWLMHKCVANFGSHQEIAQANVKVYVQVKGDGQPSPMNCLVDVVPITDDETAAYLWNFG
jgi:hypothetical protein